MDAKDLETESALERNNDGTKYTRNVAALHCNRNKLYQDVASNPLAKVDTQTTRPCAVIGPDRVIPPPVSANTYPKKGPAEPWPCPDNIYRFLPEYQHKIANNQNPTRNISPRQTFQENMPRIMVPPTYNAVKVANEPNYAHIPDRNVTLSKNIKSNVPSETKYCDVPYAVNPISNEQKNIRNQDMCVSSVQHPVLARMAPPGWPPGSVNVHTPRSYGAPELYQYPEYPSCAGPRSVSMSRPHRTVAEDPGHVYSDSYYQEANVRFKPYPNVKERYPQTRYEYIGNYSNPFHPPPFPTNRYDIPKSIHPHPYPTYPLKHFDKRMVDPIMNGYQRQTNQQGHYMPFRNQIIHPNYGPVLGNCLQSKMHPYPGDASVKSIAANKLPYDNSNKIYFDYGNVHPKAYQQSDSYFVNEMTRAHPLKNQVVMPNYQIPVSMHTIPPHPYYKKENPQLKSFEHMHHLRNHLDPSISISNPLPQFSPTAIAISPTESNISNDTTQTQVNSQEDCGYVSQSSTTSVRSMESANNRLANDFYRKYYDFRYAPTARNSPMLSRSELNPNRNINFKDKKQIDLRQFIQMWNEGEEDNGDSNNSSKEITKTGSNEGNNFPQQQETVSNQEQLYVLGLVNVSSEELSKYEHIQKVSKLPENIKGYNGIELLNQFEEVTESSNINCFKPPTPKEFQTPFKSTVPKQATERIPRPVSPLDVEAKISQSVIHKEVGCNFEIKPCSPKMLNVDIASPIQNILGERVIEKVNNPLSSMIKTPHVSRVDENRETCNLLKRQDHILTINENSKISSCKMVKNQFSTNHIEPTKTDYSLQDLESSSGVCLASLPRLDNDIELSFPEVNQQFINANKRESPMPSPYLKDLQEIIEQSDKYISKDKDALKQDPDFSNQLSPIIESEKEFTKLSKYRKIKPNGQEANNISKITQETIRTDSVIIKNPDNPKNYEENMEFLSMDTFTDETQQAPMNLTSKCNFKSENVYESSMKKSANHDDTEIYPSVDMAIDFSLNKTENNHSDYNFNIKEMKEISLGDENNLNVIQDSDDTTSTPINYQHYEDSIPAESNSSMASQNVIEIPRCEKVDVKVETNAQTINNNSSYKENVTKEPLDAVTENKLRDISAADISSGNFNSNFVVDRESYVPLVNNDSNHVSNDSLMNEDKKDKNIQFDIKVSNIDDSLDECKVFQIKNVTDKKNTTNSASSGLSEISYYDQALISSPKKEETEIQVESESKINIVQGENITINESAQIIISEDNSEKSLLRETKKNECDYRVHQNSGIVSNGVPITETSDKSFLKKLWSKNCEESPKQANTFFKRYFSKELHSPWIQKLLMYNDGLCYNCQTNSSIPTKILDIPLTATNSAISCIDYLTNEMDNNAKTDTEESTKPERTKINYRECIDDISNSVQNSPGSTDLEVSQPEVTISKFDHKSMQLNLMTDIVNDITKETSIKKLQPNTIKGEVDHFLGCDGNISDMMDNSEEETNIEELQPEIMETECDDIYVDIENSIKETKSIEELQPNIAEGKLNTSYDSNITDKFGNSGEETNIEKFNHEITKCMLSHSSECIDNITDIVENSTEQETSVEKLQLKITKGEFNNKAECINSDSSDILHKSGVDTSINELKPDLVKIEYVDNHTDEENDQENETSIGELQPGITKNEFDHSCGHNNTNKVTDILNSSREEPTNGNMQSEIKERELCIDIINHVVHNIREATKIEELQPTMMNTECDHKRECIDNITKMADNVKKEKSTKDELQSKISKVECDHNRECKSKETIPKLLKSKITNICDHVGEPNVYISEEIEDINNMKYETSKERLPQEVMNDDFYYDCPFNDVITELQLSKSLDTINSETEHMFFKENVNDYENDIDANDENKVQNEHNSNVSIVEKNTDANSKYPTNKEMVFCVPKQQIKNTNNDNTTDNKIIKLHEIDTLKSPLMSTKCQEEDIIKQNIADRTDMNCEVNCVCVENCVDPSLENEPSKRQHSEKRRIAMKRSFSDSALNSYKNVNNSKQDIDNISFFWPIKRKKQSEIQNIETDMIAENLRKIIQNNRRNSISSFYNDENVSFCILIDDNCIITEENEKVCYTDLPEDCLEEIHSIDEKEHNIEHTQNTISSPQEHNCEYSDSFIMGCDEEKSLEASWVEDVACVETVVSDDIEEDIIISGPSSPKDTDLSDDNESGFFNSSFTIGAHTDKVKYIYGGKMCSDDANFLETLYKTPQMDVNKTLINRECQVAENTDKYYDKESLEKILSESNDHELLSYTSSNTEYTLPSDGLKLRAPNENENVDVVLITPPRTKSNCLNIRTDTESIQREQDNVQSEMLQEKTQCNTVHSCESSIDDVFNYGKEDEGTHLLNSSSPEVSSTTSEEKNSSILLKITNYKGSRISQITDINPGCRSSCKYTEKKDYSQSNLPSRPLITKGAQKYIPPLKETIPDLKIKLPLSQQSLMKFKQLKISKVEPKLNKCNAVVSIIAKKPKPKFEDVLKSIDEIQFKMHKEKCKKSKTIIPKVVIKKNRNGSHYASTSNKDKFNPDLTGRKWQPWVFIEKNHFIDKMAVKNKTRAVYNHRKNTYVLAEKFCKYKSVSNAKFIISQPKLDNSSKGHLKYTIRLKHSY